LRGVLPRVRQGDEQAPNGATGQPERRQARAGTRQAGDSELIEAIVDGVKGSELKDRMAELPNRKDALLKQVEMAGEPPHLLHPIYEDADWERPARVPRDQWARPVRMWHVSSSSWKTPETRGLLGQTLSLSQHGITSRSSRKTPCRVLGRLSGIAA